ncbi:hypothetical protein E2C01_061336 [Portunus trituberculatus]|uniref:Uncharacterized protein n=1 Tax=Portunus trituberculatus TaxID=210409 RepID=A0A5B7H4X1_PORTR|nr:hypothetical protein [Portunus trituberculatus]
MVHKVTDASFNKSSKKFDIRVRDFKCCLRYSRGKQPLFPVRSIFLSPQILRMLPTVVSESSHHKP